MRMLHVVPNISSAHVTNKTLHEEMPWGMADSASSNEKIFQAERKIWGFFFSICSRGEMGATFFPSALACPLPTILSCWGGGAEGRCRGAGGGSTWWCLLSIFTFPGSNKSDQGHTATPLHWTYWKITSSVVYSMQLVHSISLSPPPTPWYCDGCCAVDFWMRYCPLGDFDITRSVISDVPSLCFPVCVLLPCFTLLVTP